MTDDHKAEWKYPNFCFECGICYHLCDKVHAIDWTYPEAGTGAILHYT